MQNRTGQRDNVRVRLTSRVCAVDTIAAAGQRCFAATYTVGSGNPGYLLDTQVRSPDRFSPFALPSD